ncbi:hypothetical protein ACQ4M3_05185 [Leptolyngbya sp. AN03gr2]|uniref:hypothetical protein n=1 Tax=unclassified Leptolyngbya TaxID=2650499 RepID=UPI003D30F48B
MADTRLATFKCDAELWEAFKSKAAENNTNASALLKEFIQAFLQGDIQIKPDGSIDTAAALDERISGIVDQLVNDRLTKLEKRLGKSNVA